MSKCKRIKKELVAFLYNELEEEKRLGVETHLDKCPYCRQELNNIKQAMAPVEDFSSEIQQVMALMDWENVSAEITERVFKQEGSGVTQTNRKRLVSYILTPRFRPVYAALLVGLMLGSFLTYLTLRRSGSFHASQDNIIVPAAVLDRIELELARKETLDYLEKSQYLILDLVRSAEPSGFETSRFNSERAKDLLSKKKYINQQLDRFEMVKAKEICDQIEMLFYELSRISEDLPQEELIRIQSLIRDRQILLKIKILKEELQESEV